MKKRWFWVVLGALAVIWLAPNVFLWSHWLNHDIGTYAPGVKLRLDGAWAPLPWMVRADRARFVVDEDAVDFEVVLRDVSLTVSLFGLLDRTLSLDDVEADSGTVALRSASPGTGKRRAALPEIAGVPLKPPTHAPSTIDRDKAWLIEIAGIDLHLSELWVDAIRLQGSARVRGAFRYRALTLLDINDARVDVRDAALAMGKDEPFARAMFADVEASTSRIDVSKDAWGLVDQLSATLSAHTELSGSRWLASYFPELPASTTSPGHVDLALAVDEGRLASPSWAHVAFPEAELSHANVRATGSIDLALLVDDARSSPRVLVEAPKLKITEPRAFSATGARAWVPLPTRRLRRLGSVTDAHAAVDRLESGDMEKLTLTPSFGVHGGSLVASGSFDQWHQRRAVRLDATLRRVSVTYDTYGLYTDARLEGRVRLAGDRLAFARGSLNLDRARLRIEDDTVEDWSAQMDVKTTRSSTGCNRGVVALAASSAEPIHAFAGGGLLEKALAPEGAVKVDADLTESSKSWSLRLRNGRVGSTPVRGIVSHRDTTAAAFFIDGPVISVGVRVDEKGVHVKPFAGSVPDGVAAVTCGA
ncbi:MAG: hypothetical protein KC776_17575 [Myxococcales bacterium]|nr:hypothetical protein [Myxococcales bacterium]MCB9581593.1 hypothetical protein [Polyangiaceae bacterium]